MITLVVYKNGKEIQRLTLSEDREFLIGRGQDCDVVLEESKGISRHHAKVLFEDQMWFVRLVSKYGSLFYDGQNNDQVELKPSTRFSIPPYDFEFVQKQPEAAPQDHAHQEKGLVVTNPFVNRPPEDRTTSGVPREMTIPGDDEASETFSGNMDATRVGAPSGAPAHTVFLQIQRGESQATEKVQLTGVTWTVGRDESCEVPINDGRISRRHFEISRTDTGYQIVDLGSANGTTVNDEDLVAKQPQPLLSGDMISVLDIQIEFQVLDANFQNMLQVITPSVPMNVGPEYAGGMNYPAPYFPGYNLPAEYTGPAVVKVEAQDWKTKIKSMPKKQKMRAAIGLLAVIAIVGALMPSSKPESQNMSSVTPGGAPGGPGTPGSTELNPEQKAMVRDTFNLARSHFMAGKYELCSSEIVKLHGVVPFYENSKELETLCAQAKELQDIEREKERLEREQRVMEEKVAMITDECRNKVNDFKTAEELEACLSPAIELTPSAPAYEDLRSVIRIRQEEVAANRAAKAERERRVAAGASAYRQAKNLFDQRQFRNAITAYEKFLRGNYPNADQMEAQANRELASARQELGVKVGARLSECEKLIAEAKFKEAVNSCEVALNEDPSNARAQDMKRRAMSELHRELKEIYEEAVIEESLGNVDAAKDRWSKIISKDLPSGEFARKSKSKLRKYGVGM